MLSDYEEYTVSSGCSAVGAFIEGHASLIVENGAKAIGTEVTDIGCKLVVCNGSTVEETEYSLGNIIVSSGGTAIKTTVRARHSSWKDLDPDAFEGEPCPSDFKLLVEKGGVAIDTTVCSEGSVDLLGVASSTSVYGDGELIVSSGGTAIDTIVYSGGKLIVKDGGKQINTTCKEEDD